MSSPAADRSAPLGVPSRAIHERQLDDDMLRLQRAATVSYQRGQRVEALRITVAVVIAVAGVLATLTGYGRTPLAITGFLWFLVSVIPLRALAASLTRQGALLQEMFDTTLFHLPWRGTVAGDPVADPDVSHLARSLKPDSGRDRRITGGWYDPTHGVHHPYDVLIAQEQNLAWDVRLRRRYSYLMLAVAVLWSVIGVLAGVITGSTVTDALLSYFVPSLSAYELTLGTAYSQRRQAAERQRLGQIVTDELRAARPGPIDQAEWLRLREVARDVQDGVLRTRLDVSQVPDWFYKRYRDGDDRDFAETAEGHRRRLAGPATEA